MSEYIPENPFGTGVVESEKETIYRKLRATAASVLVGSTTAFAGSKLGIEVISEPVALIVEGSAIYFAAGAASTITGAVYDKVLSLILGDTE